MRRTGGEAKRCDDDGGYGSTHARIYAFRMDDAQWVA